MAAMVPGAEGDSSPWPFRALADELPAIEIADIKAARQEALLGSCRGIGPARNTALNTPTTTNLQESGQF
jgi:hypothetical protein